MRPAGMRAATASAWSRAALFISEAKAPGAMALIDDVVLDQARRHALGEVDQAGLAGGVGVGLHAD